jgi:hypothetical protein
MLADAAKLSGMPMFVAATPEIVRMGLSQLATEERARASQVSNARDFDRIKARYPDHVPQPKET